MRMIRLLLHVALSVTSRDLDCGPSRHAPVMVMMFTLCFVNIVSVEDLSALVSMSCKPKKSTIIRFYSRSKVRLCVSPVEVRDRSYCEAISSGMFAFCLEVIEP